MGSILRTLPPLPRVEELTVEFFPEELSEILSDIANVAPCNLEALVLLEQPPVDLVCTFSEHQLASYYLLGF